MEEGKKRKSLKRASHHVCPRVSLNRWDPNLRMTPTQALAHSWLQGMAGATTATTSTTITTATTTAASSVQGLIALRSREEGSGEYDAKSGAAEPR